jgi:predicted transposase YbfD/YdcC
MNFSTFSDHIELQSRKEMIDKRRKINKLIRTHIQIENKKHFKLRAKNNLTKDQK